MDKHYCSVHGEYRTYSWETGGCPDCQEASKQLLEKLDGISEQTAGDASRAAYLTNNPGDYECPACRMISLKYCASRCPKCQADLPANFWEELRERESSEREQRRQADEKRQKWLASPEYAEELRLDAERKKLAIEADAARKEAELIVAKRRKREIKNRNAFCFAGLAVGMSPGKYFAEKGFPEVGILSTVIGLLIGWYIGHLLYRKN